MGTLAAFLRAELGPAPGRARATLRVLVACIAATALVMGTHLPDGHWIIFTIFTVSPEDAGASLLKGLERIFGTLAGGAAGMFLAITFGNEPHFLFVAIGLTVAVAMFLSRTTRASYASLLAGVTLLMVGVSHLDAPVEEVETALWRILMILIGVILGTGAQVLLWPSDPEDRLLDDLGERLAAAERLFWRALSPAPAGPAPTLLAVSGLARQLDFLASAEARYPALRRRHTEQMVLIGEVERVATGALWLAEILEWPGHPRSLDDVERTRVAGLAEACAAARASIAARDAMETNPAREPVGPDERPEPIASSIGIANLIAYLEVTVGRVAAATGFLAHGREPRPGEPGHSPLDTPARAPFFTEAFSLSNADDAKFGLKCALAVMICFVVMLGLDWPGLLTSVISCLITAQSTLGASLNKSLLRITGAVVGGFLGFVVIAAVMPNVETLAGLMVPVSVGFAIAAWINAGSSRISYAGLQIGMAFGICTVDFIGPSTDLIPARDRVLGILLGIAVTGLVYGLVWPVLASRTMRPTLAAALRAMALLAGVAPEPRDHAAAIARASRHRVSVYRALTSVLRLREEARTEPGALSPVARAERDQVLALTGEAQRVFLALLAVARHRLGRAGVPLPPVLEEPLADFDRSVARLLEASAAVLDDPVPPTPAAGRSSADLDDRLAELEQSLAQLTGSAAAGDTAAVAFVQSGLPLRREVVEELRRLTLALRGDRQPIR